MLSLIMKRFFEKWLFEVKYLEPANFKIARWDTGLCGCVVRYTDDVVLHEKMLKELDSLFSKHGLDETYPFGRENYQGNYRNSSFHKCPTRIKFVEDVLLNDCRPRKST